MKIEYTTGWTGDYHISKIQLDTDTKECTYLIEMPINQVISAFDHLKRVFNTSFLAKNLLLTKKSNGTVVLEYKDNIDTAEKLANYISYKNRIVPNSFLPYIQAHTIPQNKPLFEKGPRTIFHHIKNKFTSKVVEFNNQKYEICDGTINFSSDNHQYLASVGGNREIIVLNKKSPQLQGLFEEFKRGISSQQLSYNDIFKEAIAFSRQKITSTEFVPSERDNVNVKVGGKDKSLPIYHLEEIVGNQKGVCRHHALFTAFLLGEYFKASSQNLSIHHCRDIIPVGEEIGAHTWVVCKRKGSDGNYRLVIIDPMWNYLNDLSTEQNYNKACEKYSTEVVDRMLKRADVTPKYFRWTFEKIVLQLTVVNYDAEIEALRNKISLAENVNITNVLGFSLAHLAVAKNDLETLQLLIEKPANINIKSKSGHTPICLAQSFEVVKRLVDAGANYSELINNESVYTILSKSISDKTELAKIQNFFNELKTNKAPHNIATDKNNPMKALFVEPIKELPQLIPAKIPFNIFDDLEEFCRERVSELDKLTRFTKGKDNKKELYISIIAKISKAKANSYSDDEIKNLINEVATVSHHRRYRTTNKAVGLLSLGFYKKEANSWTKYKEWVDNLKKPVSGLDETLIQILTDSLRIRKDKIPVKKDENSKQVQGYEEYRRPPKM